MTIDLLSLGALRLLLRVAPDHSDDDKYARLINLCVFVVGVFFPRYSFISASAIQILYTLTGQLTELPLNLTLTCALK